MAQEEANKKLLDARDPQQVSLPENIAKLRAEFPGLEDAWTAFRGTPALSSQVKQLIEKYIKAHPDAVDPGTGKIRAEELKSLYEQLHKLDSTFEVISVSNRTVAMQHRLKNRFMLAQDPLLAPDMQKALKEQMAQQQRSEVVLTITPRLISRCLQTLDRYVVIRNRYNYPGLERNVTLEKAVSAQVVTLQQAMQRRVKAGQERNGKMITESDNQIYGIIGNLPLALNDLYMNFLDRALMRNAQLYRDGQAAHPDIFPRLDGHAAEILIESNAFQLHMGSQMIRDAEIIATPDAGRQTVIPPNDSTLPPSFVWMLDPERHEKYLKQGISNISESFHQHFDDVLGRRRPGQPARERSGLLEITWGMTAERLFTENGRMMMLRLTNSLLIYRGTVNWAVVEGVRRPIRGVFGLIPGGAWVVDRLISPAEDPEEYRKRILNPTLVTLGLPEGFDLSREAWERFMKDDSPAGRTARERFLKRMQSVATIVEEATKEVQSSVRDFEADIDILAALQGKLNREHLAGADVDEAWIKGHPIPPGVTLADINALRPENGPQILAAHAVLFRQMRGHWSAYTLRLNMCAERVLHDNVETHLKMEKVLKEAAQKLHDDDRWIWYLIGGGIAYIVSAETLGRIGRLGGVMGGAGPVGLGGRLLPGIMTAGRYNPIAILNGLTRPFVGPAAPRAPSSRILTPQTQKIVDDAIKRIAQIEQEIVTLHGTGNTVQIQQLHAERVRLGQTILTSLEGVSDVTRLANARAMLTAMLPPGTVIPSGQMATLEEAILQTHNIGRGQLLTDIARVNGNPVLSPAGRSMTVAEAKLARLRQAFEGIRTAHPNTPLNFRAVRSMMDGFAGTSTASATVADITSHLPTAPRVPNTGIQVANRAAAETASEASTASRFLRRSGRLVRTGLRVLPGAVVVGVGVFQELGHQEQLAHMERCRKELENDLASGLSSRDYDREGNVFIHKRTGARFDVNTLLRASDQFAQHVSFGVNLSRGEMLGMLIATASTGFIPGLAIAITVHFASDFVSAFRAGGRRDDLRSLFVQTPVSILSLVDAEHLTGMTYDELWSALGNTFMGRGVFPRESQATVREAYDRYAVSFYLHHMNALLREQGIPERILFENGQTLQQALWEERSHLISELPSVRGGDARLAARCSAQGVLIKYMVIAVLRKRQILERAEKSVSAANRLTDDQIAQLRAEISFLENQSAARLSSGESTGILTIGESIARNGDPLRKRGPDMLRLNDFVNTGISGPGYAWEMPQAHPNSEQLSESAYKLLVARGATEVRTWIDREGHRLSETVAAPESVPTFRLRRGNEDVFFRMIGSNLMWSCWGNPGWQPIEKSRYDTTDLLSNTVRAEMNAVADELMVISRQLHPVLRKIVSSFEKAGTNFLISRADGFPPRITSRTGFGIHTFCWNERWMDPEEERTGREAEADEVQFRVIAGRWQFRTRFAAEYRIWTTASESVTPFASMLGAQGLSAARRSGLEASCQLIAEMARYNRESGL